MNPATRSRACCGVKIFPYLVIENDSAGGCGIGGCGHPGCLQFRKVATPAKAKRKFPNAIEVANTEEPHRLLCVVVIELKTRLLIFKPCRQ